MKTYTYQETLSIVEKFMKDSGIREYCSNVCVGSCCETCFDSEYSCHNNEGRRLHCSIYICYKVTSTFITVRGSDIIRSLENHIKRVVSKVAEEEGLVVFNPYFTVNTKSIKDRCLFKSTKIDRLKRINVRMVKKRVNRKMLMVLHASLRYSRKVNKRIEKPPIQLQNNRPTKNHRY